MGTKALTRLDNLTKRFWEVTTTNTCSQLFRNDWTTLDRRVRRFASLEECQAFLTLSYPSGTKRVKMFVDLPGGETAHIGYIYSKRNQEGKEVWNSQDWVEIWEVVSTPVLL